jgi:predicted TPR repeat methyltransferase
MGIQLKSIVALIETGQIDGALATCNQILATKPHDCEVLHLQATCYAKLQQYSQAEACLLAAIKINSLNEIYHNNLANIYKLQGKIALALRHLHESLHINPHKAQTYHNLANLYYKIGNFSAAIDFYKKTLRLNPSLFEAHFNLANCYVKTDKIFKAIDQYLAFLAYNPNAHTANLNLGMLYISQQRCSDALPHLLQAFKIQPEPPELYGHIADCYLDCGQDSQAIEYYKIVNQKISNPSWVHNLAVLYLRNQQPIQAEDFFQRALTLDANNYTARHMLSALQHNTEIINTAPAYTQALFDQYAWYYDEHMKKKLAYDLPVKFRHLISNNKLQNILDLGCGTGLCGLVFRDLAHNLVGQDLSFEMLRVAYNLGAYDCLVQANINHSLPGLAQDYFELILAAEVLGYVGELAPLFANIKHTLKTNGTFIFSIETNNGNHNAQNYTLEHSGRFTHQLKYIEHLAQKNNFIIRHSEATILRKSEHSTIFGHIFILALN